MRNVMAFEDRVQALMFSAPQSDALFEFSPSGLRVNINGYETHILTEHLPCFVDFILDNCRFTGEVVDESKTGEKQ
jgi:hypothetical protein